MGKLLLLWPPVGPNPYGKDAGDAAPLAPSEVKEAAIARLAAKPFWVLLCAFDIEFPSFSLNAKI
jgi:hypothetical protein